jgi:phosphoribosyl-ATP pyrophosphohydrolase/phosphoribosyl-AMP cyclohydrolase
VTATAGARSSPRSLDPSAVRWGPDGLVPAIVQDGADGRVLMLGWQDAEALAATLDSGEIHFHSRSRDALWRKGETSGNVLRLLGVSVDCDADAVLLTVDPTGPTCHTGSRSCFDLAPEGADSLPADPPSLASGGPQGFAWLEELWATIAERARTRPEGSYTSRLLSEGVDAVSRKVTEEATEVVLAAKDDAVAERSGDVRGPTREALAGELADLVYHALVLAAERGLEPREVIRALRDRSARPHP